MSATNSADPIIDQTRIGKADAKNIELGASMSYYKFHKAWGEALYGSCTMRCIPTLPRWPLLEHSICAEELLKYNNTKHARVFVPGSLQAGTWVAPIYQQLALASSKQALLAIHWRLGELL